jgi:succinate-semialdehyde dehydrogenase/glutarate-semialdehyde dehydrogenase
MTRTKVYLNGQWHEGTGWLEVCNPATGEVMAQAATVDGGMVRQALQDAQRALPVWSALPARERGRCLFKVADHLEQNSEAMARLITQENGKPLTESRGEVAVAADHFRWFAEEGRRAYGRIVPPQAPGKRHLIFKRPVGVVAAISPWNFPLVLAARKVAPALAAGCPVLLKPASATPLCAVQLAAAIDAAGLPPGAFQLLVGRAEEIAGELLANPLCRKITFTGSTAIGKKLIVGAAANVTKLSLELGGHAPVLVFDDADLTTAVKGTVGAKFRNTGQSCIAANRIYVQRGIYPRFVEALIATVKSLKVGDGLSPGVDIGAMINEAGLNTALTHIADAVQRGARLATGGKRLGARGWFLEPTVLLDVPEQALCLTEETFAPVAPVCRFDTEAEAIARANATVYGLAAYVFTRDLNRALRLGEQLEAGTIGINDAVPSTSNCPFGGIKQSGWGRELGAEGLEAFLETKHISLGGVD